jgi:gliding motility-associated-like protein
MGPYSLNWTGPDGFTSVLSDLGDLSAGEYILNVIDDAGCLATASVSITEPETLEITLTDLVNATCNTSEDASILVDITGGTSPYSYSWSGPNGFESTDESLVFVSAGTYELTLTDSRGCTSNSSYDVGFNFVFNAVAGDDQEICFSDQPVSFIGSIEGDLGDQPTFEWTLLSEDLISSDSLLSINEEPGLYEFVFIASSGACSDSDTLSVEIIEGPDADAGEDLEVFAEENFTLGGNPTSSNGTAFAWSPNPTLSFDTTLANPTGYLLETTEFVVLVTDANGCVNSDTVLVEVLPEVSVSSGFTPNGDGINDFWVIDNMELFPNNVVQIFNRWGQVLYEANGYNMSTAWDGKYENKDVPAGTYYYTIELNDPRFPDPITGPITINR